MKKELKKIIINFSDINKKCDSDFKKLSDKCKNYKLSHNRKLKLLEKIKKQLIENKYNRPGYNPFPETTNWYNEQNTKQIQQIIDEIESEINAPLRVKSKPIIMPKKQKDIFYWKGIKDAGIMPTTVQNTFCSFKNTNGKKND